MKIYAKISSERASKGQGGNEFINVEVLDENQNPILEIKTKPYSENGPTHATIKINNEKIIWQGFLKNTKGKKLQTKS